MQPITADDAPEWDVPVGAPAKGSTGRSAATSASSSSVSSSTPAGSTLGSEPVTNPISRPAGEQYKEEEEQQQQQQQRRRRRQRPLIHRLGRLFFCFVALLAAVLFSIQPPLHSPLPLNSSTLDDPAPPPTRRARALQTHAAVTASYLARLHLVMDRAADAPAAPWDALLAALPTPGSLQDVSDLVRRADADVDAASAAAGRSCRLASQVKRFAAAQGPALERYPFSFTARVPALNMAAGRRALRWLSGVIGKVGREDEEEEVGHKEVKGEAKRTAVLSLSGWNPGAWLRACEVGGMVENWLRPEATRRQEALRAMAEQYLGARQKGVDGLLTRRLDVISEKHGEICTPIMSLLRDTYSGRIVLSPSRNDDHDDDHDTNDDHDDGEDDKASSATAQQLTELLWFQAGLDLEAYLYHPDTDGDHGAQHDGLVNASTDRLPPSSPFASSLRSLPQQQQQQQQQQQLLDSWAMLKEALAAVNLVCTELPVWVHDAQGVTGNELGDAVLALEEAKDLLWEVEAWYAAVCRAAWPCRMLAQWGWGWHV
ncbi:hypothetical protein GGR56DRAFT_154436 [Xylariaceae sp. FL0804]|nr:hypothetical protein GGR56DRAFT_154436 [Xylariaceae sp. FL0804]